MSFLFKSSKKAGASQVPNALPPASRDIRSSDGPQSQIPTLNGAPNGAKSPTPAGSASGSLNSLASEKLGMRSPPPGEERPVPGDMSRGQVAPVADQRVRNMSQDDVSFRKVANNLHETDGANTDDETKQPQRLAMQSRTPPPTDNSSPYPWSQRRLNFTVSHTNPFPRYGAAVNATSSRDGSIYLMGGLINGSTVKGDLWMCETGPGNMSCYPVATTSEGPGPRVGHASLLVGNAFIVFGGDTKMDEGDVLDDTLYLLNTCEDLAESQIRLRIRLTSNSNQTVVTRPSCRAPSTGTLRTYTEHSRKQALHFRRPSRRLLFQRSSRF